jgi:hypothetical protein
VVVSSGERRSDTPPEPSSPQFGGAATPGEACLGEGASLHVGSDPVIFLFVSCILG